MYSEFGDSNLRSAAALATFGSCVDHIQTSLIMMDFPYNAIQVITIPYHPSLTLSTGGRIPVHSNVKKST